MKRPLWQTIVIIIAILVVVGTCFEIIQIGINSNTKLQPRSTHTEIKPAPHWDFDCALGMRQNGQEMDLVMLVNGGDYVGYCAVMVDNEFPQDISFFRLFERELNDRDLKEVCRGSVRGETRKVFGPVLIQMMAENPSSSHESICNSIID